MKKITLFFLLAITLCACSADAIEESTIAKETPRPKPDSNKEESATLNGDDTEETTTTKPDSNNEEVTTPNGDDTEETTTSKPDDKNKETNTPIYQNEFWHSECEY